MRMKDYIGLALIAISFIAIFIITVATFGWKATLIAFGILFLIGAPLSIGLVLIYKD